MKKFVLQQSIAIIIYVRLNSKRLPEKALLKVNSMPLLSLIVDRIKKNSKFKFPIIIATSTNNSDNKLLSSQFSNQLLTYCLTVILKLILTYSIYPCWFWQHY